MSDGVSLSERNRKTVAAFYAAGVGGDVDTMLSYLSDDLVVREPEYLPYGGIHRGKQGLLGVFQAIQQYADVSALTIDHLVADGDRVIGIIDVPELRTGNMIRLAEESRLVDGKIVEMQIFYYDPQSMLGAPKVTIGA